MGGRGRSCKKLSIFCVVLASNARYADSMASAVARPGTGGHVFGPGQQIQRDAETAPELLMMAHGHAVLLQADAGGTPGDAQEPAQGHKGQIPLQHPDLQLEKAGLPAGFHWYRLLHKTTFPFRGEG